MADTPYVEAHMTGTLAGDKTEAMALSKTFGQSRQAKEPVLVGGIKTNVGHTEPVSGLAALVKSIFMLEHEVIPPNANYKTPSSEIPLKDWNLLVPTELTAWPAGAPKRISINNFGYGGTNAHVILDQAPTQKKLLNGHSNGTSNTVNGSNGTDGHAAEAHSARLTVISAKDTIAASNMAAKLAAFIRDKGESDDSPSLGDLAYTLNERRAALGHVIATTSSSLSELAEKLESPSTKVHSRSKLPSIAFVFNGQGAQWYAMGRELIGSYDVFRQSIGKAEESLKSLGASWSLTGTSPSEYSQY